MVFFFRVIDRLLSITWRFTNIILNNNFFFFLENPISLMQLWLLCLNLFTSVRSITALPSAKQKLILIWRKTLRGNLRFLIKDCPWIRMELLSSLTMCGQILGERREWPYKVITFQKIPLHPPLSTDTRQHNDRKTMTLLRRRLATRSTKNTSLCAFFNLVSLECINTHMPV